MPGLKSLSTSGVCQLLGESGFDEDVVECMKINKIDGSTLLDLTAGISRSLELSLLVIEKDWKSFVLRDRQLQ